MVISYTLSHQSIPAPPPLGPCWPHLPHGPFPTQWLLSTHSPMHTLQRSCGAADSGSKSLASCNAPKVSPFKISWPHLCQPCPYTSLSLFHTHHGVLSPLDFRYFLGLPLFSALSKCLAFHLLRALLRWAQGSLSDLLTLVTESLSSAARHSPHLTPASLLPGFRTLDRSVTC